MGDSPINDAEVRFTRLCALVRIGTSCQALLDVVAEEVMTLGEQQFVCITLVTFSFLLCSLKVDQASPLMVFMPCRQQLSVHENSSFYWFLSWQRQKAFFQSIISMQEQKHKNTKKKQQHQTRKQKTTEIMKRTNSCSESPWTLDVLKTSAKNGSHTKVRKQRNVRPCTTLLIFGLFVGFLNFHAQKIIAQRQIQNQ